MNRNSAKPKIAPRINVSDKTNKINNIKIELKVN
ncbi:unnamed protein product, partial [marine sediment metagenome]